jgi:hypothetical protein
MQLPAIQWKEKEKKNGRKMLLMFFFTVLHVL